jgi:hypothetical protein
VGHMSVDPSMRALAQLRQHVTWVKLQ